MTSLFGLCSDCGDGSCISREPVTSVPSVRLCARNNSENDTSRSFLEVLKTVIQVACGTSDRLLIQAKVNVPICVTARTCVLCYTSWSSKDAGLIYLA
jgi:hypothetical protein